VATWEPWLHLAAFSVKTGAFWEALAKHDIVQWNLDSAAKNP